MNPCTQHRWQRNPTLDSDGMCRFFCSLCGAHGERRPQADDSRIKVRAQIVEHREPHVRDPNAGDPLLEAEERMGEVWRNPS